jgi:ABC-type lipoprotein release transport system permease subunit
MTDLLPTSPRLLIFLGAFALLILALLAVGRVPIRYNLRNLVVRWKTTVITAAAFTLVVALLTVMLAFVKGMERVTEASGQPGNVVVLSDGANDELFSNLPGDVDVLRLRSDLQQHIEQRPIAGKDTMLASYEVYVVTIHTKPTSDPDEPPRHRFVPIRGVKDYRVAALVHDISLKEGNWFADTGEYEVILGEGIAGVLGADLGRGPLRPGDRFELGPFRGNNKVRVAGIMRSAGSTFGSEIWARDTVVKKEFGRENNYTTVTVRTKNPEAARAAATALKTTQGSNVSVNAVAEQDYYSKLAETNQVFTYAILFIAVVMSIGGSLGVMNTMFAAISQRSKDIGVLRLLGYSRGQVLVAFLLESIFIALVGGLLGCALGYLGNGLTATGIVNGGGSTKSMVLHLVVDGNILALGLLFTLCMGTVGGLVPSLSAMRLRPLESLR